MDKHNFNNILSALFDEERDNLYRKLETQKGVFVFPAPYRPLVAVRPLPNYDGELMAPKIAIVEKIEVVYDGHSSDDPIILTTRNQQGTEEHIELSEIFLTEASRLEALIPDTFADTEEINEFWKEAEGEYPIPMAKGTGYQPLPDHEGEVVIIDRDENNLHRIRVADNGEVHSSIDGQQAWDEIIKIKNDHTENGMTIQDAVIEFYKRQNFDLPF